MNKKTKKWCIENMLNTIDCEVFLEYLGYVDEDDNNTLPNLKLKEAEYNSIKIRVKQSINVIQALDINEVSKQGAISALKLVLNEFSNNENYLE